MFEQVKEFLGLSRLWEASSESWALQMSGSLEKRSNYSPDIWNMRQSLPQWTILEATKWSGQPSFMGKRDEFFIFPPSLPTHKGSVLSWFSSAQTCPICERSFQLRVPLGSWGTLVIRPDYWHVPDPGAQFHVIASHPLTLETCWNDPCVEVTEGPGVWGCRCSCPTHCPKVWVNLYPSSLVTIRGLYWKAPLQVVFTLVILTTSLFSWKKNRWKATTLPGQTLEGKLQSLFILWMGWTSLVSSCRDGRVTDDTEEQTPGP